MFMAVYDWNYSINKNAKQFYPSVTTFSLFSINVRLSDAIWTRVDAEYHMHIDDMA